jgi:hypothetical protein
MTRAELGALAEACRNDLAFFGAIERRLLALCEDWEQYNGGIWGQAAESCAKEVRAALAGAAQPQAEGAPRADPVEYRRGWHHALDFVEVHGMVAARVEVALAESAAAPRPETPPTDKEGS